MILTIQLFGSPRITQNGERLNLSRRKTIALLAYLAGTRQPQARETLMALLWPDLDDSAARMNLRRDLSRLRKHLVDDVIVADRLQVELNLTTAVSLDIYEFEAAQTAVQNHAHTDDELCPQCVPKLQMAVALAEGDFMAGFNLSGCNEFDEWLYFQREHYRQNIADSLRRLIAWCESQDAFSEGIEYGRTLLALDPLHEPAHRTLMRLYALANQQTAALRQYEECVRVLAEELGIPPEPETEALFEAIRTRQFVGAQKSKDGATQGSQQVQAAHRLPVPITAFVGREPELAQIQTMLADAEKRLITLVGAGGMGKTRLALAVAQQHLTAANSQHGVYFVALASLSEPAQIVAAVADALNFSLSSDGQPRSQQQLFDFLSQKEMLLVLDNFEHLLAGADLVGELLQQAPKVQIVATSRERLYFYSLYCYELLGEIITRVSGQPFHDFIREQIFLPLGMHDSWFMPPEHLSERLIHRPDTAPFASPESPISGVMSQTVLSIAHFERDYWRQSAWANASCYATAADILRFGQMVLNGGQLDGQRILNPASVAVMTQNQTLGIGNWFGEEMFAAASDYGYGWVVTGESRNLRSPSLVSAKTVSHTGAGGCDLTIDAERELITVYFSTELQKGTFEEHRWHNDLFVNMVQAAVLDV